MFKILLVEDDQPFRGILKQELSESFASAVIEEASDGQEAMEKVDSFPPRLIFMDIRLPGESGLQLTKKIKTRWPEIEVAMLTSYDLPEYREAALQAGASHFLVKGNTNGSEIIEFARSVLSKIS